MIGSRSGPCALCKAGAAQRAGAAGLFEDDKGNDVMITGARLPGAGLDDAGSASAAVAVA